jgi:chromosome partitioning protein
MSVRGRPRRPAHSPTRAGRVRSPRPASVSSVSIFAIANQKGGVGKTTTAVNLAAAIAGSGIPTLLVDLDPQCNATVSLGQPRTLRPNTYDVLCAAGAATSAIHDTPVDHLSLIPSGVALAGATVELPGIEGSERRLHDALAAVRGRFGYILIDCPPSLGPLTVNALTAADGVIVPVQTEYFALEGLAQVLETIELVKRQLNPRLRVAGMVMTMHDARTRLGRDVEQDVREHFRGLVFDTVIPRNIRLSEAPSFGVPVMLHDPYCAGTAAYLSLAREVVARTRAAAVPSSASPPAAHGAPASAGGAPR